MRFNKTSAKMLDDSKLAIRKFVLSERQWKHYCY